MELVLRKGKYYDEKTLRKNLNVNTQFKENIYLPNSIYEELVGCKLFKHNTNTTTNQQEEFSNANANVKHIAFAFSYVYLISYMYRYAKYIYNEGKNIFIDEQTIYKILNTSPTSRGKDGVSYITKKNGVLEKLGYLRKEKDFPIKVYYLGEYKSFDASHSKFDFVMNSEIEYPTGYNDYRKNWVSYPLRAFHYDEESEREGLDDGYFFQIHNTVEINILEFIFCMVRDDLGILGFYLFCYMKSKSIYFKGFTRSFVDIIKDTGIKRTKLSELINSLESYNMIVSSRNPYVLGLPSGMKVPANTYSTFDYENFIKTGRKTIKSRAVMGIETYDKVNGVYLNEMTSPVESSVDIELPIDF